MLGEFVKIIIVLLALQLYQCPFVLGWERNQMVKTFVLNRNPKTLYATLGGTSFTSYNDRWNNRPGIALRSGLIPPSFVTGARVHSAQNFFGGRFSNKPKRWAISTAYDPPPTYTDDDIVHEEDDIDYDSQEDVLINKPISATTPMPQAPKYEAEAEEMRPEETPIVNDNYAQAEFDKSDSRIFHAYLPGTHVAEEYRPNEDDSYRVIMEEEHQEPVRPVRHSSSPWPHRDVQRLGPPRHAPCTMPLDRGVGPDELSAWYYDTNENRCRWFGYQGHGGNANRFYSRIACEAYCVQDLDDLCQAVTCPSPGLTCSLVIDEACQANEERHGRDWRLKCPPEHPVCLSPRKTRIAPDVSFKPIPPECLQQKDSGSCERKNPAVNYHYDNERNTCMTFYFHNCGGNDNRFITKSDCMTHCAP